MYKGEYTKGPRKGEASVWKVFKTGSASGFGSADSSAQEGLRLRVSGLGSFQI